MEYEITPPTLISGPRMIAPDCTPLPFSGIRKPKLTAFRRFSKEITALAKKSEFLGGEAVGHPGDVINGEGQIILIRVTISKI